MTTDEPEALRQLIAGDALVQDLTRRIADEYDKSNLGERIAEAITDRMKQLVKLQQQETDLRLTLGDTRLKIHNLKQDIKTLVSGRQSKKASLIVPFNYHGTRVYWLKKRLRARERTIEKEYQTAIDKPRLLEQQREAKQQEGNKDNAQV